MNFSKKPQQTLRMAAPFLLLGLVTGIAAFLGLRQTLPPSKSTTIFKVPPLPSLSPSPTETAEAPTTPKQLELLGLVQTLNRASLSIVQPTKVLMVFVHNGDHVKQGQVLAELDDTQTHAQWSQAEAGYRGAIAQWKKAVEGAQAQQLKAEADLQTAETGLKVATQKFQQAQTALQASIAANNSDAVAAAANVKKAQIGLQQAQQNLQGLQQLAEVGGVSQAQLLAAKAQLAIAEADLKAAKTQLQQTQATPGGSAPYRVALAQQDLEQARTGLQQAQQAVKIARIARKQVVAIAKQDVSAAFSAMKQAYAGLQAARAAYHANQLVSPFAGVVTDLAVHTGDVVQPGVPLLSVVGTNHPFTEALVLARQLSLLHLGQKALVALDSRPGVLLEAKVAFISPVAEPDGRTFRVRFNFLHPPANVRVGQTARILIPLVDK